MSTCAYVEKRDAGFVINGFGITCGSVSSRKTSSVLVEEQASVILRGYKCARKVVENAIVLSARSWLVSYTLLTH